MTNFLILARLIAGLLGTSWDDWACYESVATYVPREEYARGCVYQPYDSVFAPGLLLYETWDGALGFSTVQG